MNYRLMKDTDGLFFIQKDIGNVVHSHWVRCSDYFEYKNDATNWLRSETDSDDWQLIKTPPNAVVVGNYRNE